MKWNQQVWFRMRLLHTSDFSTKPSKKYLNTLPWWRHHLWDCPYRLNEMMNDPSWDTNKRTSAFQTFWPCSTIPSTQLYQFYPHPPHPHPHPSVVCHSACVFCCAALRLCSTLPLNGTSHCLELPALVSIEGKCLYALPCTDSGASCERTDKYWQRPWNDKMTE